MNIDPRLFGSAAAVMRGQPNASVADVVARDEIAKLKKFIAERVGVDIQMLSKAIGDLNGGTEQGFVQLAAEIAEIKRALMQLTGGRIEMQPVEGDVVEAANVQPGDENLPPEYFQGADDESAP